MAEQENGTKKVEKVGIKLNCFPNWTGKRVSRVYGIDKAYKLEAEIPVPATDKEAQELYELTLSDLIVSGTKQLTYDRDTLFGKMIRDNDEDWASVGDVQTYTDAMETELSHAPVRTVSEKAKKVKELTAKASQYDDVMRKAGIDPSAPDAMIQFSTWVASQNG